MQRGDSPGTGEPGEGDARKGEIRLNPAVSLAIGECKVEPDAEDSEGRSDTEEVDDDDDEDEDEAEDWNGDRLSTPKPDPLVLEETEDGETISGASNLSRPPRSSYALSPSVMVHSE